MASHDYATIANSPQYKELIARRRKITWPLAILVTVAYFTFILLVAFRPDILAHPVGAGPITVGIWGGLGLIIFTFLVTLFYVRYANSEIEALVQNIHSTMGK